MSLHDKLAQKAIAMGKHSSEFSAAAQKHANATWLYLIIGGVVWYFFGWLWALIPAALGAYTALQSINATLIAKKLERQESNSFPLDADLARVVQAYGKVLETKAPAPGTVADVKKLPYPKPVIKKALVAALRITDDPKMKEHLKIGYILLSAWQEGVGENDQGLNTLALDMSQDTKSLAQAVLEQSSGSEKWIAKAQEEKETLAKELQEMGLW